MTHRKSALRTGLASALNRLTSNGRALASGWRPSHLTHADDHLRVSLDGADPLCETCFVYHETPTEPLDAYKNDRTYTLNPGFTL